MIGNRFVKKAIIYTLAGIYCFALIKPVMPLINDAIAHTFYKMSHLASVHYENGKYHVHKELTIENKDSKTNHKSTDTSQSFEPLSHHFHKTLRFAFSPQEKTESSFQSFLQNELSDAFRLSFSPPPEI